MFSKKQATFETATHGYEFIAARTSLKKIIGSRAALRYLGVRIIGSSYIFGNNKSIVLSSMKFTTKLHKRHIALSFHQVRESIAVGICRFHYLPGELNPVDVHRKH